MPDFPRYNSKAQPTTQQPSVQAPEDTSGKIMQEVGKIGQDVAEIGFKWQNAVNTVQKTTATNNFKLGMLDIQNRAANDPNYNNSDQYFKEIEKLKTDNLKGFSDKAVENEMASEFNYAGKVGQIQIDGLFKKKLIDVGQANTLKFIDTELNNPNDNSLSNIQNVLDQQVQSGIIDHKDAYQLFHKANEDLGVNLINRDLYLAQTPEQVDAVTQGITSGAYEKGGVTIEPDKKKALLDIAERAKTNTEKKVQAQQEDAMVQGRMDTIAGVASGQTPIESLDITEIAQYDPKLSETLTRVKDFMVNYNPKLSPKEQKLAAIGTLSPNQNKQMKSYAKSITDVFMQDDNKQLSEFMLRELNTKGDGLTSSVKLAAFTNLAALKAKVNNQQSKPDVETANRFNAIKAGVKFLEASSPYLSAKTIGDFVIKNFLSGATNSKAIMQEAKDTHKNEIIERYKSVAKLPSVPNKIVDGEASVEDLQAGENELKDGFNGSYADQFND